MIDIKRIANYICQHKLLLYYCLAYGLALHAD